MQKYNFFFNLPHFIKKKAILFRNQPSSFALQPSIDIDSSFYTVPSISEAF